MNALSFVLHDFTVGAEGIDRKAHIDELIRRANQAAMALRNMRMSLAGFDVVTNAQVFKCFVRSRLEYGLPILSLCKGSEIDRLQRWQNQALRSILGLWKGRCDTRAVTSMLNTEDMSTRMTVLRCRWIADTQAKDATFLIHHAQRMYQQRRRGRKTKSCFHVRKHVGEVYRYMEDEVTAILDERDQPATPSIRARMWKAVTKKWRESRKVEALQAVQPRCKAIAYGTHRMLGVAHASRKWGVKKAIL